MQLLPPQLLLAIGLLLLLASLANALDISTCTNMNVANTVYDLTAGVTSTGPCFTFSAANVTLDCHGYTTNITAANDGIVATNIYNLTLKNCRVNLTVASGSRGAIHLFQTTTLATIYNNSIETTGANNHCIWLNDAATSSNNVTGNNCTTKTDSNADGIVMSGSNNLFESNTIAVKTYGLYCGGSNNRFINNNFTTTGTTNAIAIKLISGGNSNNFTGNRFNTSNGAITQVVIDSGASSNIFWNNTFGGNYTTWWSSVNTNYANLSSIGNRYVLQNGTEVYLTQNWTDNNSDGFADNGTNLPINASTFPTYVVGVIQDWHPYVQNPSTPNISYVAPTTNSSTITNVPTITINITFTPGATASIYTYNSTGGLIFTDSGTSGNLYVQHVGLVDQTYYFNATANNGGTLNWTETRNVTIDTVGPGAFYHLPTTQAGYVLHNWVYIDGWANLTDPSVSGCTFALLDSNGTSVCTASNTTANLTRNCTGLSALNYTANLTCTDLAGNSDSEIRYYEVVNINNNITSKVTQTTILNCPSNLSDGSNNLGLAVALLLGGAFGYLICIKKHSRLK